MVSVSVHRYRSVETARQARRIVQSVNLCFLGVFATRARIIFKGYQAFFGAPTAVMIGGQRGDCGLPGELNEQSAAEAGAA